MATAASAAWSEFAAVPEILSWWFYFDAIILGLVFLGALQYMKQGPLLAATRSDPEN